MNLGDLIWYMKEGRVHNGTIWTVCTVSNLHDDWAHTNQQKELWQAFGPSGQKYVTCHGAIDASEAFATKEALLATL